MHNKKQAIHKFVFYYIKKEESTATPLWAYGACCVAVVVLTKMAFIKEMLNRTFGTYFKRTNFKSFFYFVFT